MKDITKKVVILNNLSSPHICEAIIVLKDYDPRLEGKIISEAEKIVSDYIDRTKKKEQALKRPVRKQKNPLLVYLTAIAVISAIIGLYFILRL